MNSGKSLLLHCHLLSYAELIARREAAGRVVSAMLEASVHGAEAEYEGGERYG